MAFEQADLRLDDARATDCGSHHRLPPRGQAFRRIPAEQGGHAPRMRINAHAEGALAPDSTD